MKAFWKIPKEWVLEKGLTATEALVLADLTSWEEQCTLSERAARVGMSTEGLRKVLVKLKEKGFEIPQSRKYISTKLKNNFHKVENKDQQSGNLDQQSGKSPYNPLNRIEENEEQLKNVDEARPRTREEEREKNLAEMGVVDDIKNLADELKKEIQQGGTVSESAMRLYGIPPDELTEYVGWFVDKLQIDGTQFKSRSDFRRHFNNWLRIQATERIRQQQNGKYSNRHSKPTADLFTELV